jgi:hypothetical protein
MLPKLPAKQLAAIRGTATSRVGFGLGRSMTGLASAGRGLLGILGGPWGIAIMAGMTILPMVIPTLTKAIDRNTQALAAQRKDEADRARVAHIAELTAAVDGLTQEQIRARLTANLKADAENLTVSELSRLLDDKMAIFRYIYPEGGTKANVVLDINNKTKDKVTALPEE